MHHLTRMLTRSPPTRVRTHFNQLIWSGRPDQLLSGVQTNTFSNWLPFSPFKWFSQLWFSLNLFWNSKHPKSGNIGVNMTFIENIIPRIKLIRKTEADFREFFRSNLFMKWNYKPSFLFFYVATVSRRWWFYSYWQGLWQRDASFFVQRKRSPISSILPEKRVRGLCF